MGPEGVHQGSRGGRDDDTAACTQVDTTRAPSSRLIHHPNASMRAALPNAWNALPGLKIMQRGTLVACQHERGGGWLILYIGSLTWLCGRSS